MKTFEIQRHVKGKWVHDSYMDSADQAVSIARRMADSGKHDGVRVVEDEFIEERSTSSAKFLFISRPSAEAAPGRPAAVAQRSRPPREVQRSGRTHRSRARAETKSGGLYRIIATLVILIVVGLGAHYVLQTLFQ